MTRRLDSLQALRGLACLLVVGFHAGEQESLYGLGFRPLGWLRWVGYAGVDLFFVLSGFLIADILLAARPAGNYYRVFLFRRACRLLPLYVLLLAGYPLAAQLLPDGPARDRLVPAAGVPLWTYPLFAQNLPMAAAKSYGAGWLAVTWSLAVEVQFYLLLPPLVRLAPRLLPRVCLAGLLLAPLVRAALPPVTGYVSLPGRMDALLAGVLVASLLRDPAAAAWVRGNRGTIRVAWWGLLAGVGAMLVRPEAFGALTCWYGAFTQSWLAGLFAVGLLRAVTEAPEWLAAWPLRRLGVLAYAVYLTHQPASVLLHAALRGAGPDVRSAAGAGVTLLSVGVVVGVAWGLHRTVERPFIRLGRRAAYQLPDPTRTPAPVGVLGGRPAAVAG